MANAWFTDGGRLAIVCQPTSNAEIYFSGLGGGNGGAMPMDLADISNYNTPSPMSDLGRVQTGDDILICKFKTYKYPPHNPEYEYEVRCWLVCEYATYDSNGALTDIGVHTVTELYNSTLDTSVYSYSSSRLVRTIWPQTTDTAVISNPYIFAYFGNDDERGSDQACGIGVAIFKRAKDDGSWLMDAVGAGYGSYLYREWMRSTIGVDINPEPSEPDPDVDDPNDDDDGYSGPGGGGGDHDHDTDDIAVPSLPTLSAIDTGFISMYIAGLPAVQALAAELWDNSIVAIIEHYFEHPWDYVEGLAICPVTPEWESIVYPKIGSHQLNTTLRLVSNQYVEVDCGSLDINEYYGSALDYSPYEKIQLHLPYCGSHDLDIDEIMDSTISIKYHVDVLSGACVAFVTMTGRGATDGVRYQYTGDVLSHIPITSRSYDEVLKATAQLGATAIGTLVAPGPSAGASLGAGGKKPTAKQIARAEHAQATRDFEDNMNLATSAANVMGAKPQIMRGGSVSSTMGLLGVQKPFITRTIPRQSLPENYRTYEGYPSNITELVSSLKGFTKIYSIRPNGFTCTSEELDEIIMLLKEGVLL